MKTGEQSDIPKCRQRRPVLITDATHYFSDSKIADFMDDVSNTQ